APGISDAVSDAAIASLICRVAPDPNVPVIAFRARPASLAFYFDRPIHRVNRPAKLRAILKRRPDALVVTAPHDEPLLGGWRAALRRRITYCWSRIRTPLPL